MIVTKLLFSDIKGVLYIKKQILYILYIHIDIIANTVYNNIDYQLIVNIIRKLNK